MITKSIIDDKINKFKSDILIEDPITMVNKYIIHGNSLILDDEKYFLLKKTIADKFGIHQSNIYMVGSAKLGFSIKESRRFLYFGNESDIDIAIISNDLFNTFWKEVYTYKNGSGYWPNFSSFKNYFFKGWIRPDYLPPGESFAMAKDWGDFFMETTKSGAFGPYKIAAGVYHSPFFLESYQSVCIKECRIAQEV